MRRAAGTALNARLRGVALLVVVLAAAPASAQRLQIHTAVTADAPGDTGEMRRQSVATAPDREVWVGPVALDLPPASIQTVGLELDADGTAALSLWLSDEAAQAFAGLTDASVGRALAVVWDGRVLTAPVVESPIRNGMVMITGLDAGEAERLADALREASEGAAGATPSEPASRPANPPPRTPVGWGPAPDPVRPSGIPERPPLRLDPPPGVSSSTSDLGSAPIPDVSGSDPARATPPAASASRAAQLFADAVARRDWRTAAAALHPDALRAVRADTGLRLEGATVRVQARGGEGSFDAADVLGRVPQSTSSLNDQDVAVLYLAGLDAIGAWPTPDVDWQVTTEVPDGRRVHVLFQNPTEAPGVSETWTVTLAPDAGGAWRPLLTHSLNL